MRVCRPWGLPKRARRIGGEGRLNQTPRTKLARPDHQKGKEEGKEVASTDRGNVTFLRSGGWMEVTMISDGVEIAIAGGVEETGLTTVTCFFHFFFLYHFKFCSSS